MSIVWWLWNLFNSFIFTPEPFCIHRCPCVMCGAPLWHPEQELLPQSVQRSFPTLDEILAPIHQCDWVFYIIVLYFYFYFLVDFFLLLAYILMWLLVFLEMICLDRCIFFEFSSYRFGEIAIQTGRLQFLELERSQNTLCRARRRISNCSYSRFWCFCIPLEVSLSLIFDFFGIINLQQGLSLAFLHRLLLALKCSPFKFLFLSIYMGYILQLCTIVKLSIIGHLNFFVVVFFDKHLLF